MSDIPNKALGQHWLFDRPTLDSIAELADLSSKDTVLEIGPGLGSLTEVLCERAGNVVAIEADPSLAESLSSRVRHGNLEVVSEDILQYDLRLMPKDYKVVANVPYYISSQILRRLWGGVAPPALAVLLLQKEVAERVAAGPGDMSILAFSVQYYADVSLGDTVLKELFEPAPQVDSVILQMKKRQHPYFEADEQQLFRIVKAGFGERRKKLANALAGGLQLDKETSQQLVADAGLDVNVRAQELSMQQWQELYHAWYHQIDK